MFKPTTSKQNPTNNEKLKLSTQTTLPLMTSESMVESTGIEELGQFLYHLDTDTRKMTRSLEKLPLKIVVFHYR